jgi:hypothetical protein
VRLALTCFGLVLRSADASSAYARLEGGGRR